MALSEINSVDDVIALLAKGEADWGGLVGVAENAWLEFKEQLHLATNAPRDKLELAKDVDCLANAEGGVLVVGVSTKADPNTNADIAAEVKPFPAATTNIEQIESIIREYIYPDIQGLVVQRWPTVDAQKCLVSIHVPRQDQGRKYFLVTRGMDDNGSLLGNHVGVFVRTGSRCGHLSPERIYELMQQSKQNSGLAASQLEERVAELERRLELGAKDRPAQPTEVSQEAAESRLHEDVSAASLEQDAYLAVQAWPKEYVDLIDIQSRRVDGVRKLFETTPGIRNMGFNLDFTVQSQVLPGGGLLKTFEENASLSLMPSGLLTLVIGSRYLSWGMDQNNGHAPGTINSTALVEFTFEFLRLFSAVLPHTNLNIATAKANYRLLLRNLGESTLNKIPAGTPRKMFMKVQETSNPNIEVGIEDQIDTGRVAYGLLVRVYRDFGLAPEDIPYVNDGQVNEDLIKAIR